MSMLPLVSFKTATTLSAYRIVASGTSGAEMTVIYPAAATVLPIGVTADQAQDLTVAVALGGQIAKVFFNDTCTTGTLVAADTSGRGIPIGTVGTAGSAYIGVLVGPNVSSTGTIANVLIQPGIAYEVP